MSKKSTTAKAQAANQVEAAEVAQNVAVQPSEEAQATEATEVEATETPAAKRERGYSQSAIDREDLERLNQLKAFVKEKLNVSVSNQRIIRAALDCLGDNVEAFLKGLAEDANKKQLDKERKAYLELKAKFESMETPAEEATEAPTVE